MVLLQKGIDATIIITTSFEQYASEGYHLKAHRYLIKPIQQSNFNEAIVSCIKDFKKSNRKIEVKCAYENCFISINSIVYIESYHRKRHFQIQIHRKTDDCYSKAEPRTGQQKSLEKILFSVYKKQVDCTGQP